jgi:cohesin complex subunit SA-1/2
MLMVTDDIFGGENTLDDVVTKWLASFEQHESQALADLVTFVLACAGCDEKVTAHDIEDQDNCQGRLGDIQDEFQAVRIPTLTTYVDAY